jgi:hypothetical protein
LRDGELTVSGASSAVIWIAISTSYKRFDDERRSGRDHARVSPRRQPDR